MKIIVQGEAERLDKYIKITGTGRDRLNRANDNEGKFINNEKTKNK